MPEVRLDLRCEQRPTAKGSELVTSLQSKRPRERHTASRRVASGLEGLLLFLLVRSGGFLSLTFVGFGLLGFSNCDIPEHS